MPVADTAVYVDGRRIAEPATPAEALALARERGGTAWVVLDRPGEEELQAVSGVLGSHALAAADPPARRRPRLERYDDTLVAVLRPARYLDDAERVEVGEVHLVAGPGAVVVVRHTDRPDIGAVRRRLEGRPASARTPDAVFCAVLDQVVDEYAPVVAGLQNDIDEIEAQVFDGDPAASRRIYELSREVAEFHRATEPLIGILWTLKSGPAVAAADAELRRALRELADHVHFVVDHAERLRTLLQNILATNAALVGQRQNEEMRRLSEASLRQGDEVKKISSWAAILFAPTLVGTVYGMNFRHMPELHWTLGYPMALAAMLVVSAGLYAVFRRAGWL